MKEDKQKQTKCKNSKCRLMSHFEWLFCPWCGWPKGHINTPESE